MSDLLDLALVAHGGLEHWRQTTTIRVNAEVGGLAFQKRKQEAIFAHTDLTLDVQRQHGVFADFTGPGRKGVYTPDRVAIEDSDGTVLRERQSPRDAFAGLNQSSAWDQLHALYFGGYALWNYLTAPYLLTLPGVQAEEVHPWQEAGERWRRLQVTFPPSIATHCPEQTFYYDESGLLCRHDYRVDIQGNAPGLAAHYVGAHRTVSGLVFPTHRYVVPVAQDGTSLPGPTLISIDLTDIAID
ncbi:hypothetical protein [Dactylosporangium sp. CA-092794]|uniref:hypothetical protein n=1 Tax=Dactylosporangium sp. CA-092794 TaxID=3239929 RepID=UPI003D8A186B